MWREIKVVSTSAACTVYSTCTCTCMCIVQVHVYVHVHVGYSPTCTCTSNYLKCEKYKYWKHLCMQMQELHVRCEVSQFTCIVYRAFRSIVQISSYMYLTSQGSKQHCTYIVHVLYVHSAYVCNFCNFTAWKFHPLFNFYIITPRLSDCACQYMCTTLPPSHVLYVCVHCLDAVYESFKNYTSPETLDGDNKYSAGNHGMQVQFTCTCIIRPNPDVYCLTSRCTCTVVCICTCTCV